jgi:glyoxylase I family protein
MLKNIHHIAIICSDYEVSKKFYIDILGLQVINETYRKERESFKLDLSLNGHYVIELFSFPNPPKRPFVNVGRLTNILSSALVKISNQEYSYYL